MSRSPARRSSTGLLAAMVSVGFVGLLWVLEIIDSDHQHELDQYGVRPRTDEGLLGILLAPLLHAGWAHRLLRRP